MRIIISDEHIDANIDFKDWGIDKYKERPEIPTRILKRLLYAALAIIAAPKDDLPELEENFTKWMDGQAELLRSKLTF